MAQIVPDPDLLSKPFPPELFGHYNGTVWGWDCRPIYKAMETVNAHWDAAVADGRQDDQLRLLDDASVLLIALDHLAEMQA